MEPEMYELVIELKVESYQSPKIYGLPPAGNLVAKFCH